MDFRCPLTDAEHDRWGRIKKHYRAKEGMRSGTVVFRHLMREAEKKIIAEEAKGKVKR